MEKRDPIFLKQALSIMDTRQPDGSFAPFDISLRTFNSQSGKGGKLVKYENVRLLPEASRKVKPETVDTVLKDALVSKRPNHFVNRTRNIEFPDGSVRTVKIDFIISINSYPILY